ncbi:hypothetical protein B0H14DRAFT_3863213 [Mycena olivaceomarginata]|nr:hypothetical protein B0H14DRAFT_3863213 [Mycena olivaceomarginata]
MSEREGTGSKSTGRRLDKANAQSKRPIPDSDYDEPTGPSLKRRKAADKSTLRVGDVQADEDRNTLGNVPHRVEEVAGQFVSLGTRLTQVLAAGTAVGDSVDGVQCTPPGITQFIVGGTGGNGGDGVGRGIGGIGGVGQGPSFQMNEFSGTQIIIRCSEIGGQVDPGISRIREGLANIRDGVTEVGRSFINGLLQWIRRVPRGVSDDLFYVMDPVGGYIPVPLQYCRDYQILDNILKAYLRGLPQAGGRYVERGDYGIVSEGGSFIVPIKFAQTVKAGIVLEISILQRQIQTGATRSRILPA